MTFYAVTSIRTKPNNGSIHSLPLCLSLFLKLVEIHIVFLGRGINASILVDSLNGLGRKTQSDLTSQFLGKETLLLQVDVLNLLDALVRKCHDTSLTIGRLARQVTNTGSHFHIVASCGSRRLVIL